METLDAPATRDERPGNPGDVYHSTENASFNAIGLQSRGRGFYREVLDEMVSIVHAAMYAAAREYPDRNLTLSRGGEVICSWRPSEIIRHE